MVTLEELKKDEMLGKWVEDMIETGVRRFRSDWRKEFQEKYPNGWEEVVAEVEANFRKAMSEYWWEELLQERRKLEELKEQRRRIETSLSPEERKVLENILVEFRKKAQEEDKKRGG